MIHPQLQQLLNLGLLLLLGKYAAHIYLPWEKILLILFVTVSVEHLILYFKNKEVTFFSFSSLSTAIGVMLMMVTPHLWITLLLITVGLLQKHFLHYQGKHFFNPSNFALMAGLLFFYKDAHIVLGQLGEHFWLAGVVLLLGIGILYRVNRWMIPLAFVISYLCLEYILIVSSDPVLIMETVLYRFYSVSFLVFILFMLTDPQTTPKKIIYQILFAGTISLVAVLLDYLYGFRVQHLFMALFLLSPLVVLFETKEKKKRFFSSLWVILFLVLSAIIIIENQPPYYYEMEK